MADAASSMRTIAPVASVFPSMPALVRRNEKFISGYVFRSDKLRFAWTRNIEQAAEYDEDFAAVVARIVGGKSIPVVLEQNAKR